MANYCNCSCLQDFIISHRMSSVWKAILTMAKPNFAAKQSWNNPWQKLYYNSSVYHRQRYASVVLLHGMGRGNETVKQGLTNQHSAFLQQVPIRNFLAKFVARLCNKEWHTSNFCCATEVPQQKSRVSSALGHCLCDWKVVGSTPISSTVVKCLWARYSHTRASVTEHSVMLCVWDGNHRPGGN